jgi:hypothetical protein
MSETAELLNTLRLLEDAQRHPSALARSHAARITVQLDELRALLHHIPLEQVIRARRAAELRRERFYPDDTHRTITT